MIRDYGQRTGQSTALFEFEPDTVTDNTDFDPSGNLTPRGGYTPRRGVIPASGATRETWAPGWDSVRADRITAEFETLAKAAGIGGNPGGEGWLFSAFQDDFAKGAVLAQAYRNVDGTREEQ